MESFLLANGASIYAVLFFSTYSVVALWESFAPRRQLRVSMPVRWLGNLSCLLLNGALLALLYSGWGIGAALIVSETNWGLLQVIELPYWVAFVLGFILMDFGHYAIHYLFHRVPLLWRMHRLHHTDQDFDFTTGSRFHPFEAVLEHGANLAFAVLVGAPVAAVLTFTFAYVLTTCWVHGNIRLPASWDRRIRFLFITPDMHRTHHSQIPAETNSNYAGLFSFWDRIFGTYVDQPAGGHTGMAIGLREFSGERHIRLGAMMLNPFYDARGDSEGNTESDPAVRHA